MKLSLLVLLAAAAEAAIDKATLLRKAVPVTRVGNNVVRRLDNNNNNGIEITSSDAIRFQSCLAVSTMLSNNMAETIANDATLKTYWQAGEIATQKSFVLFNICLINNCTDNEQELLMVDLGTYMALAGYRPQKTIDYCTACEKAYDYCVSINQVDDAANAAAATDDANANANANGGRYLTEVRSLQQVDYVNCTVCDYMGCFDSLNNQNNGNNANGNQITIEDVVNWVDETSQCQQTGVQWSGYDTYSQFMCNAKGTGVEIGIFLDNECTTYTSQMSYAEINQDNIYMSYSQNVVTFPFVNDINCSQDVQWDSPANAANGNNANNNANYDYQANEFCQDLLKSQYLLPLSNCALNGNGNDDGNQKQDAYGFGDDYWDIAAYDINDPYDICQVLDAIQANDTKTLKSLKANVAAKNKFHSNNTLYTYNRGASKQGASAGKIIGILFLCMAIAGALGFVGFQYMQKKKDSKKQPLVDGALA